MNILQQEDMVKGLPDEALMQEAQEPSGQLPQYLLISEVQRRADMRKRYQQQMQEAEPTVAEQVLQEGIAGLAPPPEQMQQAMNGGQPPMQPPMNGGFPPMPPGMPPQMNGAPPQMPPGMYQGGAVYMQEGRGVPAQDSDPASESDLLERIVDYYTDEDGTRDWSKIASHAAQVGLLFAGPVGWAGRGLWAGAKAAPSIYRGARAMAQAAPANVTSNLGRRIATKLGVKPGRGRSKEKLYSQMVSEHPLRAFGYGAETVGKQAVKPLTWGLAKHPWLTRAAGIAGLQFLDPPDSLTRADALVTDLENKEVSGVTTPNIDKANLVDTDGNPKGAIVEDAASGMSEDDLSMLGGTLVEEIDLSTIPKRRGDVSSNKDRLDIIRRLKEAQARGVTIPPQYLHYLNDDSVKGMNAGGATGNQGVLTWLDESEKSIGAGVGGPPEVIGVGVPPVGGEAVTRSGLLKALGALKGQKGSAIDYSKLIERGDKQARRDAFSQMLVNLGAGIAAGDMAQGLRDAGEAVAKTTGKQSELSQAMELEQLKGVSEAEQADRERDIDLIIAQLGGLPAATSAVTPSELQKTLRDMADLETAGLKDSSDYRTLKERADKLVSNEPSLQDLASRIAQKKIRGETLSTEEEDFYKEYNEKGDVVDLLLRMAMENKPVVGEAGGGLVQAADGVYRSAG